MFLHCASPGSPSNPPVSAFWAATWLPPTNRQHAARFCVVQLSSQVRCPICGPASGPDCSCHGHRVHILGLFVLFWTLPGIPQTWVRFSLLIMVHCFTKTACCTFVFCLLYMRTGKFKKIKSQLRFFGPKALLGLSTRCLYHRLISSSGHLLIFLKSVRFITGRKMLI